MAINPLSDIVLDVAKAADPLQYSAAVDKLSRLGKTGGADESFDLLLDSIDDPFAAAAEAQEDEAPDWTRADLRSRLSPLSAPTATNAPGKPYQQFEAFVLQTFIQSMFPKDATHVFGGGIAGSYWSSMLSEEIAGQVAKSGGIGIAAELAAKHPPGARAAPASPHIDGRSGLFGPSTTDG